MRGPSEQEGRMGGPGRTKEGWGRRGKAEVDKKAGWEGWMGGPGRTRESRGGQEKAEADERRVGRTRGPNRRAGANSVGLRGIFFGKSRGV